MATLVGHTTRHVSGAETETQDGWYVGAGSATERSMPDYKGTESREEVVADYTAVRAPRAALLIARRLGLMPWD